MYKGHFRFLDLPPEIRVMIYKLIIRDDLLTNPRSKFKRADMVAEMDAHGELATSRIAAPPTVTAVSRLLRQESMPLFLRLPRWFWGKSKFWGNGNGFLNWAAVFGEDYARCCATARLETFRKYAASLLLVTTTIMRNTVGSTQVQVELALINATTKEHATVLRDLLLTLSYECQAHQIMYPSGQTFLFWDTEDVIDDIRHLDAILDRFDVEDTSVAHHAMAKRFEKREARMIASEIRREKACAKLKRRNAKRRIRTKEKHKAKRLQAVEEAKTA